LVEKLQHQSSDHLPSNSGLANAGGWTDVSKETLQHVKYPTIFSLGDASSLPTSKTAAAAASQVGVVTQNLASLLSRQAEPKGPGEESLPAKYSGYTSCPLVTGKNKLILAEFSGYTGKPFETFWFDQAVERSSLYFLKAEVCCLLQTCDAFRN
jgi:NADPH-dependent 2,4-dienoyl-CoA reductase/sulfur reductase-like enzyme